MKKRMRPAGVTFVAILVWALGIFYVAGGMYVVLRLGDPAYAARLGGRELGLGSAILSWALGLVMFGVTGGLLRGNPRTQIFLTVLLAITFLGGIFVVVMGYQPLFGPIASAVAVVGTIFIWTRQARDYFRPRALPASA